MSDSILNSAAYQQGQLWAEQHGYPSILDIKEDDCPFNHGTKSAQEWHHGVFQSKKPELKYNNKIRELPFGGHIFVMARPIDKDWSQFDNTFMKQGRLEWRPCMIRGHDQGQSIYVIGSAHSYQLKDFEIGNDIAC